MREPTLNTTPQFDLLVFAQEGIAARDGQELQGKIANAPTITPVTR